MGEVGIIWEIISFGKYIVSITYGLVSDISVLSRLKGRRATAVSEFSIYNCDRWYVVSARYYALGVASISGVSVNGEIGL